MQKQDFSENIDDMYKIARSIENLYHQLYLLERKQQKESDEYHKLIRYLDMVLEVENIYYEENFNNFDECNNCFAKILDEIGKGIESDLDSIVNMNYADAVVRRIAGRLSRRMAISSHQKKGPRQNFKTLRSEILFSNNLCSLMLCKSDTLHTFLSFLQIFIDKTKNESYRDKLIQVKYYISYLNKEIEDDFQSNSFSIHDKSIHNADFLFQLNNISSKEYYAAKNKYLMQQASRQLLKIAKVNDLDYKIERNSLIVIMRLCFLKAFLLQMDDDNLMEIENIFAKIVDGMYGYSSNNESKKIIHQAFVDIDKDRAEKIIKLKY